MAMPDPGISPRRGGNYDREYCAAWSTRDRQRLGAWLLTRKSTHGCLRRRMVVPVPNVQNSTSVSS